MAEPRILIVHTGGTIAMVRGPDGFVPGDGIIEAALAERAAADPVAADATLVRLDPLIDSADATPADWNRIAAAIHDRRAVIDGAMVVHGTDTLAFAAPALAFALEGLPFPVILTGAMLPLTEPGSDGGSNLEQALLAACTSPPGVWVQFAGRRLHGARLRKTHSRSFDAFADVAAHAPPRRNGAAFVRHAYGAPEVAILPFAPAVSPRLLTLAAETCDGIVLRCYGSGTAPNTPEIGDALARARARDIPVIAVSQCSEGGIALGTYSAGAILARNGVVDGRDLTVEAAYAKLHLALATCTTAEAARAFLARPICGELTL